MHWSHALENTLFHKENALFNALKGSRTPIFALLNMSGCPFFLIKKSLERGSYFVFEVEAKNDALKEYYMRFGFIPFLDDKKHLFLPRATILKLNVEYLAEEEKQLRSYI